VRQTEYAKEWAEVHIVVFSPVDFDEDAISGNCWVYPTKSRFKFLRPLDAIRLAKFITKRRGITNITCQDPSFTALVGLSVRKEFGTELELQVHGDIGSPFFAGTPLGRIRKSLALTFLPKADHVRVVSARIKKYLVEHLGLSEEKIEVRPVPVDLEAVKNIPVTIDLKKTYPQFDKIVLMAGRLEAEKNIALAIRAWKEVVGNCRAGLVIVGRGSLRRDLEKLVAELDLTGSVVFEDWANKETLVSYYKTADLFLVTSLYEGYGLTLVEAHAAGCKIVSTDVGVAPEVADKIVGSASFQVTPRELALAIVESLTAKR
jgi:glycosyltransferase involved in cell wall biosynthesis